MEIDLSRFLKDGYLIVRELIPPPMLDSLRADFEAIVRREWPDGPDSGRPPFQPRVYGFERHVDNANAGALEFCMHENILGPTRQLLQVDHVGIAYLFLMCNPIADHGPWWWHRDFGHQDGPLQGKQQSFCANGPAHLQWNISLYDDAVLWVLPGSHIRPNTEAENRQLSTVDHSYAHSQMPQGELRHTPLPGSIPVDLKAGDGVVYANMILHWGSNYSTRHRRIIHIGTRGFGGARYYAPGFTSSDNFRHLAPENRAEYSRLLALYDKERATKSAAFHAILNRDSAAFEAQLAKLHPAETGRFTCLIDLSIEPRIAMATDEAVVGGFSRAETEQLWRQFACLDDALRIEGGDWLPGFLIAGRVPYRIYDLPSDFDLDVFLTDLAKLPPKPNRD